jgi:hypothetical protein
MMSTNNDQASSITVGSLFHQSPKIALLAVVLGWIGAVVIWQPLSPELSMEEAAQRAALDRAFGDALLAVASVIAGALLGNLSHRLGGTRPFRTAFGVSWRVAALWVILIATCEYVFTEDASATINSFPVTLLPHMVLVGSSYLVAFLIAVTRKAIKTRITIRRPDTSPPPPEPWTRKDVMQAIVTLASVIAAIGAIYVIVSGILDSPKREIPTEVAQTEEAG